MAKASEFRMPFGKYRARSLGEISASPGGVAYLEWCASKFEECEVRRQIVRHLASRSAKPKRRRKKAGAKAGRGRFDVVVLPGDPPWKSRMAPRDAAVRPEGDAPAPDPSAGAPFEGGLRFMGSPITRDALASLIGEEHIRTIMGVTR